MEKFALLNLLKAIETLSSPKKPEDKEPADAAPPEIKPPEKSELSQPQTVNVMANVIERHEAMSNRIKNNRR